MSSQKIIEDADQTELEVLFNSSAPIDAGITDDKHASALDSIDLIDVDSADWSAKDAELDNLSSDLSTEINYRLQLLGESYPFIINGSNVKIKNKHINILYIFCLILSHSKLKAKKGETAHNQKMARIFERVTLKLIQKSLGTYAHGHHFGFPREDGLGIVDAMNQLQEKLNLKNEMTVNLLDFNKHDLTHQKDLGIDQIIWVKRPDSRRHSHLFLLGQCACGQDYKEKYHDIDINKLQSYFRPFTFVPPVKMMSIPFILSDNEINRVSNSAGWLFDRISLAGLYMEFEDIKAEFDDQLIDLLINSVPYGEKFQSSYLYDILKNSYEENETLEVKVIPSSTKI